MLLVCIGSYLTWGLWYNFFNFGNPLSGHYIYVSKDVRIHGYFSKETGVREKKKFEKHCSMWLDLFGGDAGISIIFSDDTWLLFCVSVSDLVGALRNLYRWAEYENETLSAMWRSVTRYVCFWNVDTSLPNIKVLHLSRQTIIMWFSHYISHLRCGAL